jgi:hypothetical protein
MAAPQAMLSARSTHDPLAGWTAIDHDALDMVAQDAVTNPSAEHARIVM